MFVVIVCQSVVRTCGLLDRSEQAHKQAPICGSSCTECLYVANNSRPCIELVTQPGDLPCSIINQPPCCGGAYGGLLVQGLSSKEGYGGKLNAKSLASAYLKVPVQPAVCGRRKGREGKRAREREGAG